MRTLTLSSRQASAASSRSTSAFPVQLRAELEDLLGVPPPVEAEHHQVGHIGPSIICDRQPFVTLSPTGCQRRAITSITRVGQG